MQDLWLKSANFLPVRSSKRQGCMISCLLSNAAHTHSKCRFPSHQQSVCDADSQHHRQNCMRKKMKSVHKLLAGLLAVILLIPAGISPVRATETMTATVTNVTTMNHEEEPCGVFTLDNGKYYGLCAHVGLQNPSMGSTVSMTPASPALRALA